MHAFLPFAALFLLQDPAPPDGGWVGQYVFPKNGMLQLRYGTDVVGQFSHDARVVADQGDWLEVRHNQGNGEPLIKKPGYTPYMGCVLKTEVVLARDAVQFFTARIDANPQDHMAYVLRGHAWGMKGEHDNAIKDLTEAIRIKPDGYTYLQRAYQRDEMKDYDKTIVDLDEALRLLMDRGFQTEGEAVGKIQRAKQSSCQLSTYFTGRTAFYRLRQDVQRKQGDKFDLGKYHENVLSHGTIPVKYLPELVK